MITHIYIDTKKSNDLYCGSNKGHFNCTGLLLHAVTMETYIMRQNNQDKFCKRCVKKIKSIQHENK